MLSLCWQYLQGRRIWDVEVSNQLCSLGSAVGALEGRAPVPLAPPHCWAPFKEGEAFPSPAAPQHCQLGIQR